MIAINCESAANKWSKYGFVKRAEHIWKGLSNNKSQISPIPPEGYGDRFVKFISGLTMTKEEVGREASAGDQLDGSISGSRRQRSWSVSRTSTDKVIEKAEIQAQKSEEKGVSEEPKKDRVSVFDLPISYSKKKQYAHAKKQGSAESY